MWHRGEMLLCNITVVILKSNRRILVFLNMSLLARTRACFFSRCSQGTSVCLFKGRQPLFFYSADLWSKTGITFVCQPTP